MRYFDVHTHQLPTHLDDYAIINSIVGREDTYSNVFSCKRSYGIHPWYISAVEEQFALLTELAIRSDCVAIGEVGFDKLIKTPMELQKKAFMAQANLAEQIHKPLFIHCVKAWEELIACRKVIRPQIPWIIHGFRGNGELANQLIRLGFHLSFGECFNPSALQKAWPQWLLLETDDRPVDIRSVYQSASDVLGITEELLGTQIEKNISILHLG